MDNIVFIAFITGLTAGGLSCFAVQGGLLSGSIAQQVEVSSQGARRQKTGSKAGTNQSDVPMSRGMIQPILLFMAAKLVAYTFLGFLLGWFGSLFRLSPMMLGLIQISIGVFLVGNALRMLNLHPIFRYFSFEPPSQIRKYIRRTSKRGDSWITPLYLGALTVLIPCGVTQSMMAVAVGTGSAWLGAVIMFAFVLGTSPTFIGVSWLATSLGSMFQKYFYRVVAVIVLVLGLYGLNAGLTLMGSPISASKIAGIFQAEAPFEAGPAGIESAQNLDGSLLATPDSSASGTSTSVWINVENGGYSPNNVSLPANQSIELHLVTNNTYSCSRAFVIPELDMMEILPETGDTVIILPPQNSGKTIDFMCSMGMYTGVFRFN